MIKTLYHTQEKRTELLTAPCKCIREDAWLGEGYYFWRDYEDAVNWGITSKKATGNFEIYAAEIECSDILDTVFNETQYYFWMRMIVKVANEIIGTTQLKPSLQELNDYFKERGTWNHVDGILFQDSPGSDENLVLPELKGGRTRYFVYRKRIQLVVYNQKILNTFSLQISIGL